MSTKIQFPDRPPEQFFALRDIWKRETLYSSSTSATAMHPAYQQIIGMGPAVLPLILQSLAEDQGHWFWALKAITGEDPVPPEHRGMIERMAEDWLRWGRERGLCEAR